jgi:hypothetical protein
VKLKLITIMKGKPKFKIEDNVQFEFNGTKKGVVHVVDPYGTFEQNEHVSYDIFVESENTLYKHIIEPFVSRAK